MTSAGILTDARFFFSIFAVRQMMRHHYCLRRAVFFFFDLGVPAPLRSAVGLSALTSRSNSPSSGGLTNEASAEPKLVWVLPSKEETRAQP